MIDYLCPSYFKDFKCKCGSCRKCCCEGFTICISESEYFRLIGMQCNKGLREKLDCAFEILPDATADRYASLVHNYVGNCPLRDESGLCLLQKKYGEKVLPNVCKEYPRSIKTDYKECACSNSCERTIEMLCCEKSLSFENIHIDNIDKDINVNNLSIRKKIIEILQNDKLTFQTRLLNVGKYLLSLQNQVVFEENDKTNYSPIIKVLEYFKDNENSSANYSKNAYDFLINVNNINEILSSKLKDITKNLPDFNKWIENVFVNHIFYEQFPFSNSYENFIDEFKSLVGTYDFIMALLLTNDVDSKEKFVDIVSSCFRLIEHTPFDYNIAVILTLNGVKTFNDINKLIF
jgi:hypothetical protein